MITLANYFIPPPHFLHGTDQGCAVFYFLRILTSSHQNVGLIRVGNFFIITNLCSSENGADT